MFELWDFLAIPNRSVPFPPHKFIPLDDSLALLKKHFSQCQKLEANNECLIDTSDLVEQKAMNSNVRIYVYHIHEVFITFNSNTVTQTWRNWQLDATVKLYDSGYQRKVGIIVWNVYFPIAMFQIFIDPPSFLNKIKYFHGNTWI